MLEIPVNETIVLRQLAPENAPTLFNQLDTSRRSLRRFLPWVDYNTNEEHTLGFIEMMQRKAEDQEAIAFGIWYQGELCGVVDLHCWDHELDKAEIGYWLGEKFRGKGIAVNACKALISFAFQTLKLNKLEVRFALQNTESAQIPIRLGFSKEGILRHSAKLHGQFADTVVMGILKQDWKY
jgi:ribosomal-protein-serine acetyltransferase